MQKLVGILRHNRLLIIILLLALFFRTYALLDRFDFAHDGDLYSWIVKDIVSDKHLRLIGQLTTAPGIFIGPAFYYLLIPFFLLFKMDPVGAVIPITMLSMTTVASYYFVFSRLFNKSVGLLASSLYAVLLTNVFFDRRVVPSTPTNIWLVWYFYSVMMLARGNYFVLPLLGFLIGLIWHIHIALAPALVAVLVAFLLSRKLPSRKQIVGFLFGVVVPLIPFFVFEMRHGFSQTVNFVQNFTIDHGGGTGLAKFYLVLIKVTDNVMRLFFYPQNLPFINHTLFVLLTLAASLLLVRKKLLATREVILFYAWVGVIIVYYSISSVIVSEYYFANIEIIFLTIVALLFYLLYKSSSLGKKLTLILLGLALVKNALYIVTLDYYEKGYRERKAAATYITQDSRRKDFPCVSVSYITKEGENVGFRYFFWLNNLRLTPPQAQSPTYTIVLPDELAPETIVARFGHIGVIPPQEIPAKEEMQKACSGQNSNLTDPMLGFTN